MSLAPAQMTARSSRRVPIAPGTPLKQQWMASSCRSHRMACKLVNVKRLMRRLLNHDRSHAVTGEEHLPFKQFKEQP